MGIKNNNGVDVNKLLNEKRPLPFNELWKVFGHEDDEFIGDSYSLWVMVKRGQLFNIADRHRLDINMENDYYQLESRDYVLDGEIESTVKEIDKLLEDIDGNCAKHLEATYHQKYNKAIKLLRELYDNSQDTRKLDEIFTSLCEGQFSRWYYSGIYGHGMPINEIVELIKVLEQQLEQD